MQLKIVHVNDKKIHEINAIFGNIYLFRFLFCFVCYSFLFFVFFSFVMFIFFSLFDLHWTVKKFGNSALKFAKTTQKLNFATCWYLTFDIRHLTFDIDIVISIDIDIETDIDIDFG